MKYRNILGMFLALSASVLLISAVFAAPSGDRKGTITSAELRVKVVGAHRIVVGPPPKSTDYKFCPHVGSGGTISNKDIPCYCKACGDAGSGMISN
jgi:hypothetical protein